MSRPIACIAIALFFAPFFQLCTGCKSAPPETISQLEGTHNEVIANNNEVIQKQSLWNAIFFDTESTISGFTCMLLFFASILEGLWQGFFTPLFTLTVSFSLLIYAFFRSFRKKERKKLYIANLITIVITYCWILSLSPLLSIKWGFYGYLIMLVILTIISFKKNNSQVE